MNFFDRFSIAFLLIFQLEFSQIRANEIKKNSSAFDDFLTLYGRRNSLEINDINDITRNLLNKFSCLNFVNTDCYNVPLLICIDIYLILFFIIVP